MVKYRDGMDSGDVDETARKFHIFLSGLGVTIRMVVCDDKSVSAPLKGLAKHFPWMDQRPVR